MDSKTELVFELIVDDGSATDTDTVTVLTEPDPRPEQIPGGAVPTDPDGDGRYEDLNGDGELSISDVQTLFQQIQQ